MNKEQIFENKALTEGWKNIGEDKTKIWWFDTAGGYPKRKTLDRKGAPVVWDNETFTVEDIKECTEENICSAILVHGKTKILVVVNKDLPHVLIQGKVAKEIGWDEYTKDGLQAVIRHCKPYDLKAVIINPNIKTLEKFKVLKSIIKKVVETRDFLKGNDHEPAQEKDTAD